MAMLFTSATDAQTLPHRQLHMPLLLQLALHKVQHGQLPPDTLPAILSGIQRYGAATLQPAPQPHGAPLWQHNQTQLHHYPATQRRADDAPLFIIPSLINSARIFDIAPERSFLRWSQQNGQRDIYLLDWGDLSQNNAPQSIDDLVQHYILPALQFTHLHAGLPAHLMGYCLGGVLAMHAVNKATVNSLTLLASPFDTNHADDFIAPHIKAWSRMLRPLLDVQPDVPASWLYSFFATLPDTDTPAKFARLGEMPDNDARYTLFLAVEDWAQHAPPLPARLLAECLDHIYLQNALPDSNLAEDITIPVHVVAPQGDRIVPPISATSIMPHLQRAQATLSQPASGHVGAMAGQAGTNIVWPMLHDWWNSWR